MPLSPGRTDRKAPPRPPLGQCLEPRLWDRVEPDPSKAATVDAQLAEPRRPGRTRYPRSAAPSAVAVLELRQLSVPHRRHRRHRVVPPSQRQLPTAEQPACSSALSSALSTRGSLRGTDSEIVAAAGAAPC